MEVQLEIPPELLLQLRLYRTQVGVGRAPVVLSEDVERIEDELNVSIRSDLIAFFAMTGQHIDLVVELTETLREEGMPHRLLAFAEDDEGFYWCVHPQREHLVTYPAGEAAPHSLATLVRRLRIQEAMVRSSAIETNTTDLAVPMLIVGQPQPEKWADHPRFGRGRVVRELEGALELEFSDGRRRRIRADRLSLVA